MQCSQIGKAGFAGKQLNVEISTKGDRFAPDGGRRVGGHDAGLRSHQGGLRGAQERLLPGSKRNLTLLIGTPTEISTPDKLASVPTIFGAEGNRKQVARRRKGWRQPKTKETDRQTQGQRQRDGGFNAAEIYCLESALHALHNTL